MFELDKSKSTTNWVFKFLVISVVLFVLLNFVMNWFGKEVILDPVITGFVGSIIGFIIGKKGAKPDSTDAPGEEEVVEQLEPENIEAVEEKDEISALVDTLKELN